MALAPSFGWVSQVNDLLPRNQADLSATQVDQPDDPAARKLVAGIRGNNLDQDM